MNVRELKMMAALIDNSGDTVVISSSTARRLVDVALAAVNHVEQRGAYATELGKAVAKLQNGSGS